MQTVTYIGVYMCVYVCVNSMQPNITVISNVLIHEYKYNISMTFCVLYGSYDMK